jgi:hypothetical protein
LEYSNRENKIRLTLWGSIANQVEDNFCIDNTGPVIIVVTSLIVKTFKGKNIFFNVCSKEQKDNTQILYILYTGENYLSSTSGTKVYINLDILETARFMDK